MSNRPTPFSGPPPDQIPLARAPLIRVIGQVSFTHVLGVLDPLKIAPLQDALRAEYPILLQEHVHRVAIVPGSQPAMQQETIWRLQDLAQNWRVSLAPTFVALETPRYTSRQDFLGRFGKILEALASTLKPQLTQRVGLRYISRLHGEALDRLPELLRPEFVGAVGTTFGKAAQHLLSEAMIETDDAMLLARWGKLPPNATADPQAIEPIPTDSWIHDLDLFKDLAEPFSSATLNAQLEALAKRQYAVFRSMVTEEYLRFYGGTT